MSHDLRTLILVDWLENDLLLTVNNFQPASSDASFRRYFRVTTSDGSMIVMDAPPDKENIRPFIKVAALMAGMGVPVPVIYQQNLEDGFLLLEDFGSQSLLEAIRANKPEHLYQQALDILLHLQTRTDVANCDLPHYDQALLSRELGIFNDWFVNQLLDCDMPASVFDNMADILISSALAQPITCVHRDYHSRNLMVVNASQLGVIDFQDAVLGPITYDLVSLLRDCYVSWSPEQIQHWLASYQQRLLQAGLISCSLPEFTRWFDLMGLQRHLKAIGIFSRLHLRDAKSGYLHDIPRTLDYVMTVVNTYPELAEFAQFMQQAVLPLYAQFQQRHQDTL